MNSLSVPTTFVIFGATGDLIEKKIAPALFRLYLRKKLPPQFQVIGISRRDHSEDSFQKQILSILKKTPDLSIDENVTENFAKLFKYIQGEFSSSELYIQLSEILGIVDKSWMSCSNKVYYLAVPQDHYGVIIKNLESVGLNTDCGEKGEGYTRVVIEKPFGKDLESAQKLQTLLTTSFSEDQIYRLDHYLGKRMIENLLAFRFGNNFFEGAWSNKYIEKVEIKLLETNDVNGRGPFYDALGALRDVGQNHLLSFLSLVTMDNPGLLSADALRRGRAHILQKLVVLSDEQIVRQCVRGQYEGYRQTEGVDPGSTKETYFKIVLYVDHPLWRGVPFVIESGKGLEKSKKEVVITFKKSLSSLPMREEGSDGRNKLLFKLEPEESIQLDLWAKEDGYEVMLEEKRFLLNVRNEEAHIQYTQEYEKLLLDVFLGDQTFFVSNDEVTFEWSFIDPIVNAFDRDLVRLTPYQKGSDSIRDYAKEYLREVEKKQSVIKEIGVVGLGKMGSNLCEHLLSKGYKVSGFNRSPEITRELSKKGLVPAFSLSELVSTLNTPRVVLLLLPHGEATNDTISALSELLSPGDIVIDAGNSPFEDAQIHFDILHKRQIEFVDLGIAGGPTGARLGSCIVVGGNQKLFDHLSTLYRDLAVPGGVAHFEGVGAGHFVKMIHNGIEYAMMQGIAEGFTILGKGPYVLNLPEVASVLSHGSVVESKLMSFLKDAFSAYGAELTDVKGSVDGLGEGRWTVEFAEKEKLVDWAIKASVDYRDYTQKNPSFTGQILSAIRGQFGGHPVK